MYQPRLYADNNDVQKLGTEYVLNKYLKLMKFGSTNKSTSVLDIGCGNGDVLMEILVPKLPANCDRIVAIDMSEEMVNFAKNKYQNNRVKFVKLDITSEKIPGNLEGQFEHAFSSFCFQWIQEQRQAVRNLFKMLKPGGDFIIHTVCDVPIFQVYENMARSLKWAPYLQNIKCITPVSYYYHSVDPKKEFGQLLKEEGFENISCEIDEKSFTFGSFSTYQNFLASVNPYIRVLPSSKKDEYLRDLTEGIRQVCDRKVTIERRNNGTNEECIHMSYTLLVAYGSKPL